MNVSNKDQIREAHEPHRPTIWVWVAFLVAFFSLDGVIGWAVYREFWWIVVPLVLVLAHLMHAHTLAFHEAGHKTLCPSKPWNEAIGVFIGTMSLQSLTAFRGVHHAHHRYLAAENDEELWPFVVPGTPRWVRWLAAVFELTLGVLYTPMLCFRTFFRANSPVHGRAARRRVWLELAIMVVVWSGIVALTAWFGVWKYLLWTFVIPGVLAGDMHSLRKYIEHMGLTGSTILSSTRSIVAHGFVGRLFAFSLFNINYHGIHHRYAKIPQARLPEFTAMLEPTEQGEVPPYSNYQTAFWEMIRSLADPRVGAQWLRREAQEAAAAELVAEPLASSSPASSAASSPA